MIDEVDERSESGGRGPAGSAGSAGGEGVRPLSIDDTDDTDIDARVESRRQQRRDHAIEALPPEMLVALAGAPFWTASAFSAAGFEIQQCLDRASDLVEREGFDDDTTIALQRDSVAGIVEHLHGQTDVEPDRVLAEIGERVASLDDNPPVLDHWARLAASLRSGQSAAADQLLAQVHALCDANQLGDASELLEAATALARIFDDTFAAAVRVARYRIERQYRIERDRRHLHSFVSRADAMTAFQALLADDGPWALHYVGVGGVGKTTFITHLAVDQAATLGLNVARIDFDYLSPAYPGRDPGQLVQAIVHELAIHIDRVVQDRWLRSIHEQLDRLRSIARERDVRADDPIGPIAWPEFQELLSFVSSFLGSLARPVIVLDTCEELMKLSPVGRTIPSVEATFRLIEELHERIPKLRVIFAGRRLLTAGGAGWTASPEVRSQPLSDARAYLAVHELRGMTLEEASDVLAQLLPESRRDDTPLREAILEACPEDGRIHGIVHPSDAVADRRYSPFRVVRFGRWVAAEPGLPTDKLQTGGDPYIEQRIVGRMGELKSLLPTVALLRRFDARTLALVRGQTEAAAAATVRALAGHEWIYAHDAPDRGMVVEVKSSIRDQLVGYFEQHRSVELHEAREAIGRALAPTLAGDRAVMQPPEQVDAALRTMPEVLAVRAWFALEAKIGAEWGSALTLTRLLLGEDNAAASGATLLGCAVRATHLSALIHRHPDIDVATQWHQIADATAELEQIAAVRMLRSRALLGVVSAEGWRGLADPDALARQLDEALALMGARQPRVACTWVVSALEGLIERLERSYITCTNLDQIVEEVWLRAQGVPALDAFVYMLRARAAALQGRWGNVITSITSVFAAERTAGESFDVPATCVDWLPPASLRERLRVETYRLLFYEDAIPRSLWPVHPEGDEVTDDGDRLISAEMHWQFGKNGKIERELVPVKGRDWELREPAVYRRFAPAAVTLAVLRWDWQDMPKTANPVDAMRIRLARARRTRDPAMLDAEVSQTSSAGGLFIEAAQAAALVLERAERVPATIANPRDAIEHWSYQRAITHRELVDAVDSMRPHVGAVAALISGTDLAAAARALATIKEVVELARYTEEPLAIIPKAPRKRPAHPDHVETVIRLDLQAAAKRDFALSVTVGQMTENPQAVQSWSRAPVGVARLAIEEAELLSLRFPDRAAGLFAYAERSLKPFGVTADADAASLARHACERTMGKGVPRSMRYIAGPLHSLAMRVENSSARVAFLERDATRDAPMHRRLMAWFRRYSSVWLVLGIGSLSAGVLALMWLVYDRWLLPELRRIFGIPESRVVTTIVFFVILVVGGLYAERLSAGIVRRLRSSRAWQWLQSIWPWRYRVALVISNDTAGLRLTVARRRERRSWIVPRPGAGQLPSLAKLEADLEQVAVLRGELAARAPAPVAIRADIERSATAPAWEAPLVAKLPHVVIWRALPQGVPAAFRQSGISRGMDLAQPATPASPTYIEQDIAKAWLTGCRVDSIGDIHGIAHLVGRPRRLIGSIDLERARTGDRAPIPSRSGLADRRLDDLDVVLQLAPQDNDQASSGTRTELGLLRELARSIIERGASSVLVVPAIAHQEVEAVVTVIAGAMGRGSWRPIRRLLEAARRCRAMIAALSYGDHVAIADEVSLFVAVTGPAPEWKGTERQSRSAAG